MGAQWIGIALAIVLALSTIGCGTRSGQEAPAERTESGKPDQIMTNAEIYLVNQGARKATIKADLLKAYSRVDTTLLYTVEVQFFDTTGVQTSTLTCDSARVSQRTNQMAAHGHVNAWTTNKRKLIADSLRWDANNDRVVTEGYVEVYRNEDKLSGYGLETDQHLDVVTIRRNVQGKFTAPERKPGEGE